MQFRESRIEEEKTARAARQSTNLFSRKSSSETIHSEIGEPKKSPKSKSKRSKQTANLEAKTEELRRKALASRGTGKPI